MALGYMPFSKVFVKTIGLEFVPGSINSDCHNKVPSSKYRQIWKQQQFCGGFGIHKDCSLLPALNSNISQPGIAMESGFFTTVSAVVSVALPWLCIVVVSHPFKKKNSNTAINTTASATRIQGKRFGDGFSYLPFPMYFGFHHLSMDRKSFILQLYIFLFHKSMNLHIIFPHNYAHRDL